MKKFIALTIAVLLFAAALPAMAEEAVFEPQSVFFLVDEQLDEQAVTSVDVSLAGGTKIKAVRFGEFEALSFDVYGSYGVSPGTFFLSSDVTPDGAKVTFHGYPDKTIIPTAITVRLYSDENADDEIASDDLSVRVGEMHDMYLDEVENIAAGEPVDITVKVTFENNVTGEDDLVLPLESLELIPDPDYEDLGLTFTPSAAASEIKISSAAAKLGTEEYAFRAELESGESYDGYIEITVASHTVSFSTPAVLAMATEKVDYTVLITKRPANTPLASFDVIMTLCDDDYYEMDPYDIPDFRTVSSDTGSLSLSGLAIDLDKNAPALRIHGTATEQWNGEFRMQGWLKGGDRLQEPDFESEPLNIVTIQIEDGDALDVDNAAIRDPDGKELSRMKLDVVNTLTVPLSEDVQGDAMAVTVRTPSQVIEHIKDAAIVSSGRAASKSVTAKYIPREKGDYIFEVVYVQNGTPYYEDLTVGAGDLGHSSGSSGCNAGFAGFALAALAVCRIFRNRRY